METNPEIYEAKYLQETETDGKKVVTVTVKHFKKVVAVQDESSNWYVIPAELHEDFRKLSDAIYNAYNNVDIKEQVLTNLETDFHNKFTHYRTGGDLNNVQLYSEV